MPLLCLWQQLSDMKMQLLRYCFLLFLFIIESLALTCRSEHGPKDEELRKVFNDCLKQQDGNNNENRRHSSDNDWKNRGENQRNQWEKDSRNDNKDEKEKKDRTGNRDVGKKDRDRNQEQNSYGRNDGRQNMKDNMNDNRGIDGRYNTNERRDNKMSNVNGMERENSRGRNDMRNSFGTTEHLRGQDEFLQSEEYGDTSQNNYYASLKPPRRYKREKRPEMNSGQRSQYNPHSQRSNGRDNNQASQGKNSSDNSSKELDKACVLHCFMENLHMTGDSGMPDRYLVTHALTKDEKNEDLRDFLQESIEECFQILNNENTKDKCEFSKNLLTCLSEKGRANCDDWNGKPSFMF